MTRLSRCPSPRRVWLGLVLVLALAGSEAQAQLLPRAARWETFETEHFRVSFEAGLEPLARRAAAHAEWAHALLARELIAAPRGRIDLIISNNVDFSNGSASVFPRNRIFLYAQPPASEATLAYHDDWLELLVLHELVHIFHLDDATGVWVELRRLFGRGPLLFPQVYSPSWVTEGLATYIESEHTDGGRVRGAMFDMMLRSAILEDAFFSVDRASLDPVLWPGGTTRYLYGALFVDHLARRFGPEAIAAFVTELGRQLVPFRIEAAARRAFDTTLAREWTLWEQTLRSEYQALADSLRYLGLTEPEMLTFDGRVAIHPRFSPAGDRIAYSASTGREEMELRVLRLDGAAPETVARRAVAAPVAWLGGGGELLYSQLDFHGPEHVFSDLYVARPGGAARRVTNAARVRDPDVHPDGRRVVGVGSAAGTNVLVLVDLADGSQVRLVEPSLDRYWSAPRWSPDGRFIAVARWEAGMFDIVLLDPSGEVVREITRDRAVESYPAWSPDGRYLLFTSDRTGIPNLFAFEIESGRLFQITNVLTGAFHPDVSPDGRWIAYSHYGAGGYDVALLGFEPERWRVAPPAPDPAVTPPGVTRGAAGGAGDPGATAGGPVRPYSAWPTVLPASWSILFADRRVGTGVGIGLGGEDAIARHTWGTQLLLFPGEPWVDGAAGYVYRGWGDPTLELRLRQERRPHASGADSQSAAAGTPADVLRREREAGATLAWLSRGWRSATRLDATLDLRDTDLLARRPGSAGAPQDRRFPLDLGLGVGLGFSSLRNFGLSALPQEGVRSRNRVEARRFLDDSAALPEGRDYWRITSRNEAFRTLDWFGFVPPVLGARLDAGIETGAATPGFGIGGAGEASPRLAGDIELLRRGVSFPVRGYAAGSQRGNRAVGGTLEYRFPLMLVERGWGLLPLAVDRISGDLFLDAATAWCPAPCSASIPAAATTPRPLLSVGAETLLNLRLAYYIDLPLRFGVAFPLRDPTPTSPHFYLLGGTSF